MRRWMVALALLLPVAGIAAGIIRNEIALASAETWVVPITGFDPRDPLRGHYIAFRYMWQAEGDPALCDIGQCLICLAKGENGAIRARIVARGEPGECPSRVDPEASHITSDFASRIFVSETLAPELDRMLRDGPMQVVARLRDDGILMNLRIEPVARGQ